MTDAIEKDVSEEDQQKAVEAARSNANGQRLEGIQELAQQAKESRDAEIAGEEVHVDDDPHDENDDPEEDPKENLEELQKDEEPEETRTLKVNGEDIEVPLSKIIESGVRTYQKETSADQRLAEATRMLNEAKALANPPSSDVETKDSAPSKADAEQLAKTLIDGDLDEVTDVVQKLIGAGRQETTQNTDRSEVFGLVQNAIGIEKAMNKFKDSPENGGFSDLYGDPTLQKMVMDKEAALLENGDDRDPVERLTEVANEVREWRSGIIKDAGLTVSDFDKRKDKKLSANSTVEGSGGRETSARDSKPKTRSEVRKSAIEKMAAARGQQID